MCGGAVRAPLRRLRETNPYVWRLLASARARSCYRGAIADAPGGMVFMESANRSGITQFSRTAAAMAVATAVEAARYVVA